MKYEYRGNTKYGLSDYVEIHDFHSGTSIYTQPPLTLFRPMELPIILLAIKSGGSIVYIEGLQLIRFKIKYFLRTQSYLEVGYDRPLHNNMLSKAFKRV